MEIGDLVIYKEEKDNVLGIVLRPSLAISPSDSRVRYFIVKWEDMINTSIESSANNSIKVINEAR